VTTPNAACFYTTLAVWWPLISPVEEYVEEAAFASRMLRSGAPPIRDVLELGSGGGHNAAHLKSSFRMTLVDLSQEMLDVSRRLNPECQHVCADMRSLRLNRTFDAVFVHDAIDYMTTEDDLRAAMETVFVHCRPGGVAVFIPDHTRENFEPGSDVDGSDAPDGRGIRLMDWTMPIANDATTARTEYVFVIKNVDGTVAVHHETHTTGVFPEQTWLDSLVSVGFVAEAVAEETTEDRPPRTVFLCRRPVE
jgi:SAM-dependent methyltransferase